MKRPTPHRKRNRDQIRYRLHTSLQAAAYLADSPSEDDIDRELSKIMSGARRRRARSRPEIDDELSRIMNGARPKTPSRPGSGPAPAPESTTTVAGNLARRTWDEAVAVGIVTAIVTAIVAVPAAVVAFSLWALWTGHIVAFGVAGAVVLAAGRAVRRLVITARSSPEYRAVAMSMAAATRTRRKQTTMPWLDRGGIHQIRHGTGTDETGKVTGYQQEQPS